MQTQSSELAVIKTERYGALIEEIQAALVEGGFNARMTLIETHHAVGRAILDYVTNEKVAPTALVKEVAQDLNQHERGIWDSYRIAKEYPTVQAFIDAQGGGKNVSWSAGRKLLASGDTHGPDFAKVVNGLFQRYGTDGLKEIGRRINNKICDTQ
jgi:hypothetical protein